MADSHHYQTGVIVRGEYSGKGKEAWDLVKKIQVFLGTTVGNGWTAEYYTGQNADDEDEYEDYLEFDPAYDPNELHKAHVAGDHVHGDTGKCLFVTAMEPWGVYAGNNAEKRQKRCKTAYFKYSDGQERDSEFFISIINEIATTNGKLYGDDFRVGALNEPYKQQQDLGGFLDNGYPVAYNVGEKNVSACVEPENAPFPDYFENYCNGLIPVVTYPSPFATNPWNYRTQPGYVGESAGNLILGEDQTPGSNWAKYHFFGGVENGAPYFYCVVEGYKIDLTYQQRQRSFSHFGFGRLAKIGDYDGGEFYVSTNWTTNTSQWANGGGYEQNCSMFDSTSTRYAEARSGMLFNKYRSTYDEGNPFTHFQPYLFGYGYNNYQYRCYGDMFGGFYNSVYTDGGASTFSSQVELWRNNVRLYDEERDDGTYMLVGIPPAYRILSIPYFQPEEVVVDREGISWMIFPVRSKYNDSLDRPSTSDYGMAYRIPV